jgi:putative addiction module antidote
MKQKIIQIGNSQGVIIPKEMMDKMGYKVGDELYVVDDQSIKGVVLSEKVLDNHYSTRSTQVKQIIDELNEEYHDDLKELANK